MGINGGNSLLNPLSNSVLPESIKIKQVSQLSSVASPSMDKENMLDSRFKPPAL